MLKEMAHQPKLLLISANRIPSERANAYQTIKMAEAMAQQGWTVELVVPRRRNIVVTGLSRVSVDIFSYYRVQTLFDIKYLPCLDLRWVKLSVAQWWFPIISLSFAISLTFYLIKRRFEDDFVIYTREDRFTGYLLAQLKPILGLPMLFEAHHFPATQHNLAWQRRMDGIVTISHHLQQAYSQAAFTPDRLLVAPDGVDLRLFSNLPAKEAARTTVQLPSDRPLVIYTGHLFHWKGVYTLAEAARHLPETLFVVVGGMAQDLEEFRVFVKEAGLKNVEIVGHVPPDRVPLYLAGADILVLPNSAKEAVSRLYTSPLKMFEYMAAKRPIVASDLPSIREVLTGGVNARLVPPDDARALANGIQELLNDPDLAQRLAHQARQDVDDYTWLRRAERVTAFVEKLMEIP